MADEDFGVFERRIDEYQGEQVLYVTAWSNGSPRVTGAGYGLRVPRSVRDRHFEAAWDHVHLDLTADGHAIISLSRSFWAGRTELRSAAVGRWLLRRHLAPWSKGDPPTLSLLHLRANRFRLAGSS